ncbi:MAG: GNAT family N-acetyltransferase [Pseudomonadota bacterium]
MLQFKTVLNPKQLVARHSLLQSSLRPDSNYDIELEYPQVFSLQDSSITGLKDQIPIVHANILYREFAALDGQTWKAALIGNVATEETFRGQGLQKQLFRHLESIARNESADVLVLWSDLESFYEKLGFCQFGGEVRYQLAAHKSPPNSILNVNQIDVRTLSEIDLEQLMAIRPPEVLTLKRTPSQFKELLTIPDMGLFLGRDPEQKIQAWAITGKGCDMQGVFHEWGATSPQALSSLFSSTFKSLGVEEFMVLAPSALDRVWHEALRAFSISKSDHYMALVKQLSHRQLPAGAFIWGLDSI